jgi:uncharacterized protein (DUF362 family)
MHTTAVTEHNVKLHTHNMTLKYNISTSKFGVTLKQVVHVVTAVPAIHTHTAYTYIQGVKSNITFILEQCKLQDGTYDSKFWN